MSKSHIATILPTSRTPRPLPKGATLYLPFDNHPYDMARNIQPEPEAVYTIRHDDSKFGSAVSVEASTTNLISNPGFEFGSLSSWSIRDSGAYQIATPQTKEKWEGGYACQIEVLDSSGDGSGHHYAIYQQVSSDIENDAYTLSAYLKAPIGRTIMLRITRQVDDVWQWGVPDGGDISVSLDATGQWQRIHITIPAWSNSGTTNGIEIRIGFNKDSNLLVGDICYVDAVQLEAKLSPTSFTNGTRGAGIIKYTGNVLNADRDFTIAAWIKYINSNTSAEYPIVNKYSISYKGFRFELDNGGELKFLASGNEASWEVNLTGVTDLRDDKWHHCVVSVDQDGPIKIFVDGVEEASTSRTGTSWNFTQNYVVVGRSHWSSVFFKGLIDELLILDRVVSPDEVLSWYYSQSPFYDSVDNFGIAL